ncbi:protein-disulfide reductase DsbD family protein [Proteus vulgaris]|uniref:protein-disulfide reductase DsbD family protein n=1 Tax=Proteus vulgaris TaxID=585 RepID=UPI000C9EE09A|nr:protein-disulfide reductase DsbD domain-containing protein [Proteus vulgaris]UBH62860.1 thioredoxin family protein [Proteus vulgaris]VTP84273.1 metal resistance protein [Proteus vulgaris]
MFRSFVIALVLTLFTLSPSQAADTGWLAMPDNSHAQVRATAQKSPTGDVKMLLEVQLESGWKTYWRSPGEGGVAPEINWSQDVSTMIWHWPSPSAFDVAGIHTQGYDKQVTFPIELTSVNAERLTGVLTLSTCSNVCILTDYTLHLDLTEPAPSDFEWQYSQAMAKTPVGTGLISSVSSAYNNSQLTISLQKEQGDWVKPNIYLDPPEGMLYGIPKLNHKDNNLIVSVDVTDDWGDDAGDISGKALSFVITDQGFSRQVNDTIGKGEIGTVSSSHSSVGLWSILAFALLGGLILNLMPCVLPVLAMKLGSILHLENRDKGVIRKQFSVSVLGILVSFWALALFMTGLRYSQEALGWGIQFQSPWFIGFMVLVTAIFTANLLGLFELRLSSNMNTKMATAGGQGYGRHFWEGAFATLLATPCSAPFLGTAVAYALIAPLSELWLIFTALGIGMSLPWILVAVFPSVAKVLPKPGKWMNRLRVVLGFMMLLSSIWLITLLIPHLGMPIVAGIFITITLLLLLAIARHYGKKTVLISTVIALFLGGSTYFFVAQPESHTFTGQDSVNWQPLSEEAIHQALADNKRVFVDVTADWCVTCKANKYNVLLREDIQAALSAPDVVALRGDWTKPSDKITQFLKQRGQVAVPFNQIYGPCHKDGVVLPPLLNKDSTLTILSEAKGAQ